MVNKRSEAPIDPELRRLLDAARAPGNEAAERALSDQIAQRLEPDVQRLRLTWKTDPSSPKRQPRLYAQPQEYFALKGGLAQFAEAVAVLADGRYETTGSRGTVVHHASTHRSGVGIRIEIVLFEHEDHTECARLLPGLIARHQHR
jgi:hypothetical protein